MVDAFLACRSIMPKWQNVSDEDSMFWKFVHTVVQLDERPMAERQREGDLALQTCCHWPLQSSGWDVQGNPKEQTSTLQILSLEEEK